MHLTLSVSAVTIQGDLGWEFTLFPVQCAKTTAHFTELATITPNDACVRHSGWRTSLASTLTIKATVVSSGWPFLNCLSQWPFSVEWSILYVIIICFAALLWTTLFLWICICCISRYQQGNHSRPSYKRKIKRTNRFHYTVISQCDNLEMVATNPSHKSSPDLSSDSEASQTLFTRDGHHRANVNKHANLRNLVT